MNKDELKGKAEAIKGKAKQAVGDLTDDERLYEEGLADEAAGDGGPRSSIADDLAVMSQR